MIDFALFTAILIFLYIYPYILWFEFIQIFGSNLMLIPYQRLNSSHSRELLESQTDANSKLSDKSQL